MSTAGRGLLTCGYFRDDQTPCSDSRASTSGQSHLQVKSSNRTSVPPKPGHPQNSNDSMVSRLRHGAPGGSTTFAVRGEYHVICQTTSHLVCNGRSHANTHPWASCNFSCSSMTTLTMPCLTWLRYPCKHSSNRVTPGSCHAATEGQPLRRPRS